MLSKMSVAVVVNFAVVAWMAHVNGQAEMRALRAEAEATRIVSLRQEIESLQSARAYHDQLLADAQEATRKARLATDMAERREKVWRAEMDRWKASSEWRQDRYTKLWQRFNWVTGWLERAPMPRLADSED